MKVWKTVDEEIRHGTICPSKLADQATCPLSGIIFNNYFNLRILFGPKDKPTS
jgi:hypothetical protein